MKYTIKKVKSSIEPLGVEIPVYEANEFYDAHGKNVYDEVMKNIAGEEFVDEAIIDSYGTRFSFPYTMDTLPMMKKRSFKQTVAQLYKSYDMAIFVDEKYGSLFFCFDSKRKEKIVKPHKQHKQHRAPVGSIMHQTVGGLYELGYCNDKKRKDFNGVFFEDFFKKYIFNIHAWNDCYPTYYYDRAKHDFNECLKSLIENGQITGTPDVLFYMFPNSLRRYSDEDIFKAFEKAFNTKITRIDKNGTPRTAAQWIYTKEQSMFKRKREADFYIALDNAAKELDIDNPELLQFLFQQKVLDFNIEDLDELKEIVGDNIVPAEMSNAMKTASEHGFVLRSEIDNLLHNVKVVYGMAGTGKSYRLIEDVLDAFNSKENCNILILTPTGTAAHNLKDKLDAAKTRGIGFDSLSDYCYDHKTINTIDYWYLRNPKVNNYNDKEFDHNRHGIADYIFVDEASMVGTNSLYCKVKTMADDKTQIMLYGDTNQLPPVGDAQSILEYAIYMDDCEIEQLTEQHRSGEQVIERAMEILDCGDTELEPIENPDIVLCYMNATVDKINFEKRLNPDKWEIGEPVMCISNKKAYKNIGVCNGSFGYVIPGNKIMFERAIVPIEINEEDMVLAYAITIHKSQGHEWDRVAIANDFDSQHEDYIKMLYTGVTRARVEVGRLY